MSPLRRKVFGNRCDFYFFSDHLCLSMKKNSENYFLKLTLLRGRIS